MISVWFFCYHTSHLYHVRLIDGAAGIIIIFYYMETLDHAIFSCLGPFFSLPPYAKREKKPSEYGDFCNRTRAASTASDRAIHYTIAPRLVSVYDWPGLIELELCFESPISVPILLQANKKLEVGNFDENPPRSVVSGKVLTSAHQSLLSPFSLFQNSSNPDPARQQQQQQQHHGRVRDQVTVCVFLFRFVSNISWD